MFFTKDSPELAYLDEQSLKNLLGGKGASLVSMSKKGLNVPPFVVIPTSMHAEYVKDPEGTMEGIRKELPAMMDVFIDRFGYVPLLSVRSGARVSCPGMMDTILNVGLDDHTHQFWIEKLGQACAYNSRLRLIEMFANVVYGVDRDHFKTLDLLEAQVIFEKLTNRSFPEAPDQLLKAIEAVFKSWDNERAVYYRQMNNIPNEWGTAVTLQAMVFGNMNDKSCTGVLFSRDPDTGQNCMTGEFLINAQGEDVVAGTHTPDPIIKLKKWNAKVYEQLVDTCIELEAADAAVQDIEFTVQDGELFLLQCRKAKLSAQATVRITCDLAEEKVITREEGLKRMSRKTLAEADQPKVDPKFKTPPDAKGIPACSGVVTGKVVHTSQEAIVGAKTGTKVILVAKETTPDDIQGMDAAVGIITMKGGATSHAAVVARAMNKPCIVGVGLNVTSFLMGCEVTMCGATGRIWKATKVPVIAGDPSEVSRAYTLIMGERTEIGGGVPAGKPEAYMLDVSDKFLWPPEKLVKLISACLERVQDRLYLSALCLEDPHLKSYYRMFYQVGTKPPTGTLNTALGQIKTNKTLYVLGMDLNGKAIKLNFEPADPIKLANMEKGKTGDVVFTIPAAGLPADQAAALQKIIKWQRAEGVKFVTVNEVTETGLDFVTRSKAARKLLE